MATVSQAKTSNNQLLNTCTSKIEGPGKKVTTLPINRWFLHDLRLQVSNIISRVISFSHLIESDGRSFKMKIYPTNDGMCTIHYLTIQLGKSNHLQTTGVSLNIIIVSHRHLVQPIKPFFGEIYTGLINHPYGSSSACLYDQTNGLAIAAPKLIDAAHIRITVCLASDPCLPHHENPDILNPKHKPFCLVKQLYWMS